jgi:circadian clock protein KaiC
MVSSKLSHAAEIEVEATSKAQEDRVSTGIKEFDNLIEGGIPRGYLVLLAGNPGSGKTIFAAQFLYDGLKAGESGVYVSFAENHETFMRNMKKLNMDFEKYEREGLFRHLDFVTVKEKGVDNILMRVLKEVNLLKAKRLVIDSISALNQAFVDKIDVRITLHSILGKIIHAIGITVILISEIPIGSKSLGGGAEEFVVDGVVIMRQFLHRGFSNRKLQVLKMRGTKTSGKQLRYDIGNDGVIVYPHHEIMYVGKVSTERVEMGVEGLDLMLEGGLLKGSITKVGGASGTGKTTLGTHFLVQGVKRNEKGIFVSFEEPVPQLIRHGESFGWPLQKFIDVDLVKIVSYFPETYNVEDLLLHIRNLLNEQKPARFVLDGITNLQRILSEDDYVHYLQSLQSYFKVEGITAIFTSIENGVGSPTDQIISTIMDNIINLRHVEVESALKRSLVIFKARDTAHDKDIREFEITQKGIVVKEKFAGLEQVLGGAPRKTITEEVAESWAKAFGGKT